MNSKLHIQENNMVMQAICIGSLSQENLEGHSTNSCVFHAVAVNGVFQ